MQYEAIFELREVLRDLHIEYVFRPAFDGYQIVVIADRYAVSFVQHMGSYGSQNDLIEAWANGEIPVLKAIRDISKYNDWEGIQQDEFIEIANSLGYFRTGRKKGNDDLFE